MMLLALSWMADQGLDGIGFEEASNAHRIFWPDNRSVTVERNIKFDNNNLLIPRALPAKGERGEDGHQNAQDSSNTFTNPITHLSKK